MNKKNEATFFLFKSVKKTDEGHNVQTDEIGLRNIFLFGLKCLAQGHNAVQLIYIQFSLIILVLGYISQNDHQGSE